jgi:hypothetical protein
MQKNKQIIQAEVQADDEDERGCQVQIHTEWPMIRYHEMMWKILMINRKIERHDYYSRLRKIKEKIWIRIWIKTQIEKT